MTTTLTSDERLAVEAEVDRLFATPGSIGIEAAIDFCKVWPTAKPALQWLATAFGKYAIVINLAIFAGDKVFEKKCGGR